ncbi:MAG TPA: alpha/beta hydrolase [Thermoleophilaceae bacterium]
MLRHVTAPDGVRIACEVSGSGPPLVAVHGAGSARWSFDLLRPHLQDRFTVIALDRRGRGDSSDAPGYSLDRECDDVTAVVRDAGDGALLFGHSYGGLVAAGAALRLRLPRLALYEPPMGGGLATEETIDRWEALIEDGERDAVTRAFLLEIAGYSDADVDRLQETPLWEARRQIVHTVPRELRAELAHRMEDWRLAEVDVPALLLVGSESPAWAVESVEAHAETLPRAEKRILQGEGHGANLSAPELLAAELARFFATGSDVSGEP